ncbi:MAG: hypothetical protein JW783_08595 [Bacteroidales bacterium]|nr:hypothetical protein [Bacteroidales bacterium]MBN2748871.1 hypothetical protein [Bacteroidales bacterium]
MDRARLINDIVRSIAQLKQETEHFFSDKSTIPSSGFMIEEFFQQKFNPFLTHIASQVKALPDDEYLVFAIDGWIKHLQKELERIDNGDISEVYAELTYAKFRFYPQIIDLLQDLKLEVLERTFNVHSSDISAPAQQFRVKPNGSRLDTDGVALLIALLYNFKVVTDELSVDQICERFGSLTGLDSEAIKQSLAVDFTKQRMRASVSNAEAQKVRTVLKAMVARVESLDGGTT